MNDNRPTPKDNSSRQFSLRSLMWFVAVCSVWCSQIAVLKGIMTAGAAGGEFHSSATFVTSAILTWCVLAAFYVQQRQPETVAIHITFPLLLLGGGIVTTPLTMAIPWELLQALLDTLFFSSLVSFPLSVATLLLRAARGGPIPGWRRR